MLKKKTSVKRSCHPVIGGDWLVAENNAAGAIVNLVPEFPASAPYRGNFHAIQTSENHLNAVNTAHCEEDDELASANTGELMLRWLKICKVPGEDEKFKALPREKTVTVPHLLECHAETDGWLYLKMSRTAGSAGDVSFQDEVLGDVQLRFDLLYAPSLPNDSSSSAILPLASATVNDKGEIEEIIQQQFGPGVLWVPDDVSEESSSSDDPPIDPPDIPVIPDEPDEPVEPDDPDDPDDPDVPDIPEEPEEPEEPDESSSSENPSRIIIVELEYHEVSTGDFAGTGIHTMKADLTMSGTFTTQSRYPSNGYTVQMTGTMDYDYGDGDTSTEDVIFDMTVFKNTGRSCWDIFQYRVNHWAGYYQGTNPDEDTDFSTPVYIFPPLDSMADYPSGTIQVEHRLLYGVSNEVLDNDLSSTLTITFTVI